VLRYPAIFLIGLFLTLGPAPFERLHLEAANRSLARVKVEGGSHSGSKPLPVRPPVHNSSTCVICAMLHAPLTAQHLPPMGLAPTALLGYSRVACSANYLSVSITAEQCRGPPSA
jgi:hypothetical protein